MPNTLRERDWEILLERINTGNCTPFLGAGACEGTLPLGSEIAQQWAKKNSYPFEDCGDLVRVAQYLAVEYDPMYPKEMLLNLFDEKFQQNGIPDLRSKNEPHSVLADLPLLVYMTTNYDDLMVRALKLRNKNPYQELCPWNSTLQLSHTPIYGDHDHQPDVMSPLVYHLHGHSPFAESLVLTEDDYLDFLLNISRDDSLIRPRIQAALTNASLLFVGYNLSDWSFRVIFRGLVASKEKSLRRMSISVQLPPISSSDPATQHNAQKYLDSYFGMFDIKVYWGTAREFMTELRQRWEDYKNAE